MCAFCENFDFGTAKAVAYEVNNNGHIYTYIDTTGGNNRYSLIEQFNYCPVCGEGNPNTCGYNNIFTVKHIN